MNSLKKIVVAIIINSLILTFSSLYTVHAANSDETTKSIMTCDKSIGHSAQSTEELFSSVQTLDASETTLTDIRLSYKNNDLIFSGTLNHNSKNFYLSTSGQMYKNEKTTNSGEYNNLILTEMKDSNGWHFVRFGLEKGKDYIDIILQNTSNYELLEFMLKIDSALYDLLYDVCKNPISGNELEKKIAELYSINNNLLNDDIAKTHTNLSGGTNNDKRSLRTSTYNGYLDMINKLRRNKEVSLSSLSDIDIGMFTSKGWHTDDNFDSADTSRLFITCCLPNGPDRYLIQFCLGQVIRYTNPKNCVVKIEYVYTDGMLVEYDKTLKKFTVVYYNMGLRFPNMELLISVPGTNAFFTSKITDAQCTNLNNKIFSAIGGWTGSAGQTAIAIINSLSGYTKTDLNKIRTFPLTEEGQRAMYGKKLIQTIAVSCRENNIIELADHYLHIEGQLEVSNSINVHYVQKYTVNRFVF